MKNILSSILITAFFVINGVNNYAQENKFYYSKVEANSKVSVYFELAKIAVDDELGKSKLFEALLSSEGVLDGDIYIKKKSNQAKKTKDSEDTQQLTLECRLDLDLKYNNIEYIRDIVQSVGFDINMESAKPEFSAYIYHTEYYSFHKDFDPYKDYNINDRSISKEDFYDSKKAEWVKNNPEEYKKISASTSDKIVIKRKDLKNLTEEYRQEIINNTSLYTIED